MDAFEIKFALADNGYFTALRLAVGAVCAAADLDVDATEDMKVCITESCLILQGCGFERACVTLCPKCGLNVTVKGEGGNPAPFDNGFSLALISALVEECEITDDGGVISKISLKL